MVRFLAAITRDVHRLEVVTDVEEARGIVDVLLGPGSTVTEAPDDGARNDFWLEVPDTQANLYPEYVSFGVLDLAVAGVGRITANAT